MDFIPNYSCVCSPGLCLIVYQQLPLPESRDEATAIPALPCSKNPPERPCLTLCSKVCQWEHSLHGKHGMRCWRPATAAAVLCKDPNSSWDLLVQVKQEKAAEPVRLWLLWLDQVQLHICFKPERAFWRSCPTLGLFVEVVHLTGTRGCRGILIWFLKRCVQRGSEISATPHCTVRKEEKLMW